MAARSVSARLSDTERRELLALLEEREPRRRADATRYLAVPGTNIAELAPGYLARTGHRPGVKADYDPFQ
jgi:hypothetical protein